MPLELVAPFVPPFPPHLQVVLLRDLEQESRTRRIIARADKAHIRMIFCLIGHGTNIAIRRRRKELRGKAKGAPLPVEPRHEKGLTELPHFHNVPEVGSVGRPMPLWSVIP